MQKFIAAFLTVLFLSSSSAYTLAADYQNPPYDGEVCVEHLPEKKGAKVNLVKVTNVSSIIQKENVVEISFAQNFNSKYYKEGDFIQFEFFEDLKTCEGTCLIPKCSSLIAKIVKIQKPRWFSRNAIVCVEFTHIVFPNGKNIPVVAKISGKKDYLQMTGKDTAKKIAAYTLSIGGVGSGLGAAIGVAAGNTITGLIIGGSIGGGVGLVSGIVSPGLHYRAKKGQKLPLVLEENLKIPKM